jgi:hypothetical protein
MAVTMNRFSSFYIFEKRILSCVHFASAASTSSTLLTNPPVFSASLL